MAIHYTKKKDEQTENTADPWNIYGVNFGKENKVDSKKVAWEITTIKEAPAEPLDNVQPETNDVQPEPEK